MILTLLNFPKYADIRKSQILLNFKFDYNFLCLVFARFDFPGINL